jgi:hypothetical protein
VVVVVGRRRRKEGGDGKIIEDVNEVSRRLNGGPQFLKAYRSYLKRKNSK